MPKYSKIKDFSWSQHEDSAIRQNWQNVAFEKVHRCLFGNSCLPYHLHNHLYTFTSGEKGQCVQLSITDFLISLHMTHSGGGEGQLSVPTLVYVIPFSPSPYAVCSQEPVYLSSTADSFFTGRVLLCLQLCHRRIYRPF